MGTQTVAVTSRCLPVYPAGLQPALNIKNAGPNTVYLDSQNGVATGYPLSIGSSIVWDAGKPLYLSCAPAELATVYITDNAGSLFDASAVASQILTQGLAAQVATQILATGVQVVDSVTTYLEPRAFALPLAGTQVTLINTTDTSKIQTLLIHATVTDAVDFTKAVRVTVSWYRLVGAAFIQTDEDVFTVHTTAIATYAIPAKGPFVVVKVASIAAAAQLVNWYGVSGSQRIVKGITISEPQWNGFLGWTGSTSANRASKTISIIAASAGTRYPLPLRAGKVTVSVRMVATTAPFRFVLGAMNDAGPGEGLFGKPLDIPVAAGASYLADAYNLPNEPCAIITDFIGTPVPINAYITITWE